MGFSDLWEFVITFAVDTSKVKEGADDAKKSASGMAHEIMKTGEAANMVGGKFVEMVKQAGALAAAYFAVSTYAAAINETEALGRAAETLGDAVEDVDAFGRAAARAGGDVQGAMDSLTDISEKVGEALQDTESQAAKTFAGLRIKLKDTQGQTKGAVDAMLELAGAVEGLSREEAIFKIKELGVTDNRTVDLLLKGRVALEDMMKAEKAFGVVTKEDTEVATKFKQSLQSTTSTFGLMVTKINTAILPAITWTIDAFRGLVNFLGEHRPFVVTFFTIAAAVITGIYIPAVIKAGIDTWIAFAPLIGMFAAIAAGAALVALVLDDFVAYLDGQNSLLGRIEEKWPSIAAAIKLTFVPLLLLKDLFWSLIQYFSDLINMRWDGAAIRLIEGTFSGLLKLFPELQEKIDQAKESFRAMGEGVVSVWDAIVAVIEAAIASITGAINSVTGAYQRVKNFIGLGDDEGEKAAGAKPSPLYAPLAMAGGATPETIAAIQKAKAEIAIASSTPLAAQTSTSIANSRTVSRDTSVSIGKVEVQTQATDADGISKSIGTSLNDQMRQAANNFDDGVAG